METERIKRLLKTSIFWLWVMVACIIMAATAFAFKLSDVWFWVPEGIGLKSFFITLWFLSRENKIKTG